MRKALIFGSLVCAVVINIQANQVPEGVTVAVDFIGGNPHRPFIPTYQPGVEEIPALDQCNQRRIECGTGGSSGIANPHNPDGVDPDQPDES